MRIRQRRWIRWSGTGAKPAAKQRNERWSMDFVSDCISSGRVVRMLTLVDGHTRECPVIEVDTSPGGLQVCRVLFLSLCMAIGFARDESSTPACRVE